LAESLPFTGERFVPGTRGEIWIEHWHRYHFARRWVEGKRVLDVACGEGYGAALLARSAAEVVGVDVSEAALAHARTTYRSLSNLRFEAGSCARLPLADASVDVAVSFETIEHIGEQEAFLDELARVLRPDGILILSSPNRAEYSDRRGFRNEFHVRELYREELARVLGPRFPFSQWHGQRLSFFSLIGREGDIGAAGDIFEVDEANPAEAQAQLANPLYFIVVAAKHSEALASANPSVSVLSDRGDWAYRDWEKVTRELRALAAQQQAAAPERGWRWWVRWPFARLGLIRDN
jgi:SAM-dependent methyltransferase